VAASHNRNSKKILLFNKYFFRLSICTFVAKIQPDKVVRWCADGDFLHPVFPVSRVQHISDMNSKFALDHIMTLCRSMVDIQSATAKIRRGIKKDRKEIEITGHKYNVRICYAGRP